MSKFAYVLPETKEEALTILKEASSKARIVAGCTNILPDLRNKKITDCVLVDISNLEELKGIKATGDTVTLGSLTTITELLCSDIIANHAAVLGRACKVFADPLVRNRATIGGNLANASPAADGVIPLMALDASVTVESLAGKKEVPVTEFFVGPGKSVLKPDELITAVNFAKTTNMKSAFIKFGLRKAMAISLANIGVVLETAGDKITRVRIALGALAPTPLRATKTEEFLLGNNISSEVLEQAANIVKTEVDPISDVRASREYRLHLTGVLLKRAIGAALA